MIKRYPANNLPLRPYRFKRLAGFVALIFHHLLLTIGECRFRLGKTLKYGPNVAVLGIF